MSRMLCLLLALLSAAPAYCQAFNPGPAPISGKIRAEDLSIVPEKFLLSLNETIKMDLRIRVATADAAGNEPLVEQYNLDPKNPLAATYRITNWRVLDGNGHGAVLTTLPGSYTDYEISFKAPNSMPASKSATIAVDVESPILHMAKFEILQIVYFSDAPTEFYFDCPHLGIVAENYVVSEDGGMLGMAAGLPTSADPTLNARLAQAMKQAQAAVAAKGMDLANLTSNCRAIYDPKRSVTAITIHGGTITMQNGKPAKAKRDFTVALTFPGASAGSFRLKSDPNISASFMLPGGLGCGCVGGDKSKKDPVCGGGYIRIAKYDMANKIVAGTISVNLSDGIGTFFGNLSGKFTAKLANSN